MVGLPVLAPDDYEILASKYENQDHESHLLTSYTTGQVDGYRAQLAVYSQLMRFPHTTFSEKMMFQPYSIQNLHPVSRGTVLIDPKNPEGQIIVDHLESSNDIDINSTSWLRTCASCGGTWHRANWENMSPGKQVRARTTPILSSSGYMAPNDYLLSMRS